MSSRPQSEVLGQLHRYKQWLIFGGGVVISLMILFAFGVVIWSTVAEHLADERQAFLVGRNLVMDEIKSSESLFRSTLVAGELAWREENHIDPALVERFGTNGYAFVLQSSSASLSPVLLGIHGKLPQDELLRRYVGLTARMGRVSAVNALLRGKEANRYFIAKERNLAGILTAPQSSRELMTGASGGRKRLIEALGSGLDELSVLRPEEQADARRPITWMAPTISPLTGKMAIRLAAPVLDEGAQVATLVTEYAPEVLTSPLSVDTLDGIYMVIGQNGAIVASTAGEAVDPALVQRMQVAAMVTSIGHRKIEIAHDGVFTISDRLGDTGWVLVYAITWRDVLASIGREATIGAAATIATLSVMWIFLIYFKLRMYRPVLERSRRVFESEHLSRTLIETVPVGLALIAVESGEPLLRSPAMIGAAARLAMPEETLTAELVRRYRQREGTPGANSLVHEDWSLPAHDGATMDFSVSAAPARYQGQDVLVTAFTDVTAQRQIERRLREAKLAADSANAAKSAFLAAMSHEIRTPLNAIIGNLELLSCSPLAALQRDRLKTVRQSSQGLLAIVSDVLDFSKIEAGEMTLEHLAFDAHEVATRALAMFGPVARAKGLTLSGAFGPALTQPMQGDPTRLGQVMNNLLSNAIKFTERGEVTLRMSVEAVDSVQGGQLVIEVEDSGVGMSLGQQALLFRAFSQADATINRRFGGTGLGLALCARLIDAMGGSIAVRSAPGEGSVFTVRLPLGGHAWDAAPDMPRFAGERVLFLARADVWHTYAVAALEAWGLSVQACHDPAQIDQAMLEEAQTLIICGEHDTWHTDDERRLAEEAAWIIDCGVDGPACPVAAGGQVKVSCYGLKGLAAALRYTLEGEPLAAGEDVQRVFSRRLKVLVAEDNAVNRRLFEEQFSLLGCETHLAEDGQGALECLQRERFDVLVTDLALPVLDGYALASEARLRWPEMPVVAATANATPEERARCEAAGVARVVIKPLQLADLAVTLSAVTGVPGVVAGAGASGVARAGMLGGRPLPAQMLKALLASRETSRMEIEAAYDAGDAAAVLAQLHSMRGALSVLGYGELAARHAELDARIRRDGLGAVGKSEFDAMGRGVEEVET
ncbi:hybrid sensor histidine kinase/response regulator [Paraburkholderia mimosarum]|uniref:hybrid sensor histidine kinase/response regulator n=1 Tax=Paraburkholderia mimosarum TaxID=312026 RepID=UPI0009DE5355|nr:ATP-binding protein [Paraburkholderia mimosarum]